MCKLNNYNVVQKAKFVFCINMNLMCASDGEIAVGFLLIKLVKRWKDDG